MISIHNKKSNDADKRKTRLNLRLDDKEFELLKAKAEGFGLPLAKFVRVSLLGLPEPAKRIHDLPVIDAALLRQLVSMGNNVNQLTRYAHTVSLDPKQTLNTLALAFALQKIGDELQQLRELYSLKNVEENDLSITSTHVTADQFDSPNLSEFDENY
ncbi:MobC family plasmid mobilization relaxosome protein [Moraxella osloensis]|uniref:MobC family plasmid mobilization relaxosome protein n=1 Tax=Moraxella sp. CTOTU49803 TaxID=2953840 RepID=UPI0024C2693A|nr:MULTISPECIES: MobC family plasmid mobilization relaxosome protein [Moraxella]MDK1671226.1 MobC family plasmid mobilization relaxosome protein [Moraxella osloensis]